MRHVSSGMQSAHWIHRRRIGRALQTGKRNASFGVIAPDSEHGDVTASRCVAYRWHGPLDKPRSVLHSESSMTISRRSLSARASRALPRLHRGLAQQHGMGRFAAHRRRAHSRLEVRQRLDGVGLRRPEGRREEARRQDQGAANRERKLRRHGAGADRRSPARTTS